MTHVVVSGPRDWASSPGVVVFDLDGTVADSQEGILACLHETLALYGRRAEDHELRALIGPPLDESFRQLGFAEGELVEVVDVYRHAYDRVGVALAHPYDGVIEVLRALRERGVTLALATAKRVDFAERMLEDFGVRDLFAAVAGATVDDRLTTKEEIVAEVRWLVDAVAGPAWMVGDRRHDVEAAATHGLVAVGALWGYGSLEELRSAGAQWLVAHPVELLAGEASGAAPRAVTP
ncbi:MAG: HAD hydrolase-like protein [Acidobacteriota bacterium]|nr:HAD hydrolase-like protein [Acidobacteriota bacterium]